MSGLTGGPAVFPDADSLAACLAGEFGVPRDEARELAAHNEGEQWAVWHLGGGPGQWRTARIAGWYLLLPVAGHRALPPVPVRHGWRPWWAGRPGGRAAGG